MVPKRDFGHCDVYIASRFKNARVVEALSAKIESIDPTIRCIQTWSFKAADALSVNSVPTHVGMAARVARADLAEIDVAQVIVALTQDCDDKIPGGMHVEFGYAMARGLRLVVVGPRMNVFHYLPDVIHYDTIDAFLADIQANARLGD
jgi:nucleoside 2-deoxyribosyltransferase